MPMKSRVDSLLEVSSADVEKIKSAISELTKAQSLILLQAQTEVPSADQAEELSEWIEEGGSLEDWEAIMHDSVTSENYRERLGEFADLINPLLIGKNQSAYAVVSSALSMQRNALEKTQSKLERKSELLRALAQKRQKEEEIRVEKERAALLAMAKKEKDDPEPTEHEEKVTDALDVMDTFMTEAEPPATTEIEVTETAKEVPLKPHERKREAKVMVLLMAVLAAIQKQPHKFEEFKDLPQEEIDKAIAERGPELIKKYLKLATRGRMQWDQSQEAWKPHAYDQANLDVKFGIWLLGKAGFNVKVKGKEKNVEMVAPGTEGTADPIVLQFDTMDSAKRLEHELTAKPGDNGMHFEFPDYDDMGEGEFRITVDHHTADQSERETSGAQLIYEYFSDAGLIEKDPALEKLMAFVTAHDNGEMPVEGSPESSYGFYGESADTLWGIANDFKVPRELVYQLLKKYKPEDHISQEDLDRSFEYTDRRGTKTGTLREVVEAKEKQIAHNIRMFGYWQSRGYVVDTKFGPTYIMIDAEGRNMPPQQTAKAFGVNNVLVWQPRKHSFFLAIGKDEHGNSQEIDFDLPQGDIIRGHLAIYKKQLTKENQKLDFTMEFNEMLRLLEARPQRNRSDVFSYADRDPRGASVQTLYHIYHYPGVDSDDDKEAVKKSVIDELQKQEARFQADADRGNTRYQRLRGQDNKKWITVEMLKEASGYVRGSRKQRDKIDAKYAEIGRELRDRLDAEGPKEPPKKTRRGKNGGNGNNNS